MLVDVSYPKWRILFCNDQLDKASGMSGAELAGQHVWDHFNVVGKSEVSRCLSYVSVSVTGIVYEGAKLRADARSAAVSGSSIHSFLDSFIPSFIHSFLVSQSCHDAADVGEPAGSNHQVNPWLQSSKQ